MAAQLRLLITEICDRACPGCCNNEWDLAAIPVTNDFMGYEMILLTGGEPLLYGNRVVATIERIRAQTQALIILYTAAADRVLWVLDKLDGVTLTLHTQDDVADFLWLNKRIKYSNKNPRHMRLNIFKGVDVGDEDLQYWTVKSDIEWLENCPLPAGEIFRRLDLP